MSQVISFRLDKDNPREARALALLKRWQEEGLNTRHIVIEALLRMDNLRNTEQESTLLVELNEKLCRISQVIERLDHENLTESSRDNTTTPCPMLSSSLIDSIKKAVKPGIKL